MNDWSCRYCEHLKSLNKAGSRYVGVCEFRMVPKTCGQFELAKCFNGKDPRQLSREDVLGVIAKWIECHTIADLILDIAAEQGIELTVENAKRIWLNVLMTELPDGIRASAKAVSQFLAELND